MLELHVNNIMRISILIITLLLAGSICTAQTSSVEAKRIDSLSNFLNLDTCISLMDLAKMEENGVDMDSMKVEYEKRNCNCYYEESWEGKLPQTGLVLNCKASGKWVEYDGNGDPMMITTMRNDKRNGEFLSYREGKLVLRCHYKDDKYHGKWQRWDHDGNLIEEIVYDNGMVLDKNIIKHWEPNGVKTYLFEVEWYNKMNNTKLKKPGAYIWHEGKLILFKEWTPKEIENRRANIGLIKKAQKVFYDNMKQ